MTHRLIQFLRDVRGVAALELALVAPILTGLVVTSYSLWDAASRRQDLRTALEAGAEYYLNGGSDDATGTATVVNAWSRRPKDSSINFVRSCKCGTDAIACSDLCAAGAPPAVYVNMELTANDPTAMASPQILESRVVRVR